jgi:hypothetical protein
MVCLFNSPAALRPALRHHAPAGAVYLLLHLSTDEEKMMRLASSSSHFLQFLGMQICKDSGMVCAKCKLQNHLKKRKGSPVPWRAEHGTESDPALRWTHMRRQARALIPPYMARCVMQWWACCCGCYGEPPHTPPIMSYQREGCSWSRWLPTEGRTMRRNQHHHVTTSRHSHISLSAFLDGIFHEPPRCGSDPDFGLVKKIKSWIRIQSGLN